MALCNTKGEKETVEQQYLLILCVEIMQMLISYNMYDVQYVKKKKHSYLFQYILSYGIETGSKTMEYCLLQFDAVNFFLGVRLHGGV